MVRTRACDPCAVRKTRCDRGSPCRRCKILSLSCTTIRAESKPGPKGPWAEKKRRTRRESALTSYSGSVLPNNALPDITPFQNATSPGLEFTASVSISSLRHCLEFYSRELYPLWPVVDRDEIETRLQNTNDIEAYALATAVSAVTIAQLKLPTKSSGEESSVDCERMGAESERARAVLDYQDRPSIDILLSSFFLHVFRANCSQICKATLLLREAVTFAQLLEFDKPKHYLELPKVEEQLHLRIVWLLFVTERGHTTRFDLPRVLQLDQGLPALEVDEDPLDLLPFVCLCRLFQTFCCAMDSAESDRTRDFFVIMDARLRETQQFLRSNGALQRADFLITQQWMRVVLWKMSMFHIELSANSDKESLAICFPERVARNVTSYLSKFPPDIIEAHGLGMEMKLAEVAISLADLLLCVPTASESPQLMRVGARELLASLGTFLMSLRGGNGPRLQMLQEKLLRHAWNSSSTALLSDVHYGLPPAEPMQPDIDGQ